MTSTLLVLAAILLAVTATAFYGWLIMLAFGIVHSFAPSVPAVGFWPCAALGLIFGALTGGRVHSSNS